MNEQRLRDVIRAARESKHPFTMRRFHSCGTPGCLIGNYAARRDLQQLFQLAPVANGNPNGGIAYGVWGATRTPREWIGTSRIQASDLGQYSLFAKYFDITHKEAHELFGTRGCDDASTAGKAARYVERFIERRSVG